MTENGDTHDKTERPQDQLQCRLLRLPTVLFGGSILPREMGIVPNLPCNYHPSLLRREQPRLDRVVGEDEEEEDAEQGRYDTFD